MQLCFHSFSILKLTKKFDIVCPDSFNRTLDIWHFIFCWFSKLTILLETQLITNDKFKSVEHRVVANHVGPRVSVASFFNTSLQPSSKLYGPIKDLVSDDNPPKYMATTVHDYVSFSMSRGLDGTSPLPYFRIGNFWYTQSHTHTHKGGFTCLHNSENFVVCTLL